MGAGLLTIEVSQTVENEVKEQKGDTLGTSAPVLVSSLLGNMLAGKGVIRADERMIRAGQGFNVASFIDNSFEVQNYYQNEPKFEGVYLRNSSPKIKDETHVINLDVHKPIGTHCIAM